MKATTYLTFDGRCEEALDFYSKTVGAQVQFKMRFSEAPDTVPEGMLPAGFENKIMHMAFTIGETTLMATDGGCSDNKNAGFHGFSISVHLDDEAEAERVFKALGEGGTVTMPMGETFFAKRFGTLNDKFGLGWMVLVEKMMG